MRKKNILQKGVTFIELIVVISIFALISSVVLFNFSGFSTNITLQNISHDIALKLVEAQRASISGKYHPLLIPYPSSNYAPSYGLHLSTVDSASVDFNQPGKELIYFIDRPDIIPTPPKPPVGDEIYNAGQTQQAFHVCADVSNAATECIDRMFITTGESIIDICIEGQCNFTDLTVLFRRPFPDAIIKTSTLSGSFSSAEIKIQSIKGDQKTIVVTKLGQVSVK